MDNKLEKLLVIGSQIANGVIPKYEHNECFTAGAYDLLIFRNNPTENYELLSELCAHRKIIFVKNEYKIGLFKLLEYLVPATNTTQMPDGMAEIMDEHPIETDKIRKWYRL